MSASRPVITLDLDTLAASSLDDKVALA
jgi:hypothetical protein